MASWPQAERILSSNWRNLVAGSQLFEFWHCGAKRWYAVAVA